MWTFLGINLSEWLTIAAIVIGPIAAIQIDRYLQRRKEIRERKVKLFRELMATRGTRLSTRHVEALNLISVEYSSTSTSERPVLNAWKNYHAHLNDRLIKAPAESNDAFETRSAAWGTRQIDLLTALLKEMAVSLNYTFDDVEIRDGGYSPQGWMNIEGEQNRLRQLLIDMLSGERPLQIMPFENDRHQQ